MHHTKTLSVKKSQTFDHQLYKIAILTDYITVNIMKTEQRKTFYLKRSYPEPKSET